MPKSWIELRIEIHPFLAEAVSNFLLEQGSPGVIQEKIQRPSKGKGERIIGYFPNDRQSTARIRKIQAYLQSLPENQPKSFNFRGRIIKEKKWAETWKSNFKLLRITPRLIIKPPWEKYTARKGELVIDIDPGMAFGTGTHPSTQMCLKELEEIIRSSSLPPSVLDVGTGSGILAIAARKLGARTVLAIDIDSVAIAWARKNAKQNHLNGAIDFRLSSLMGLRRAFDIVVANLLPQELLSLVPYLPKRMSSGGKLVISGLLRGQKKEVTSAFSKHSLEVLGSQESKGWACLVMGLKNGRRPGEK